MIETFMFTTLVIFVWAFLKVLSKILESRLHKERQNRSRGISFRKAMDLTGLPTLILYQGGKKLNFILDSGATHSAINLYSIEGLTGTEKDKVSTSFGIDGNINTNHIIELSLFYDSHKYIEEFQVMDLSQAFDNIKKESGVKIHGILGSSFLSKYRYIIDFDKMIAYQRM